MRNHRFFVYSLKTKGVFMYGIIALLFAMAMLFVAAVFGGTIVWFVWPYAMNAFPGLVKAGYLTQNLGWGSSVALTYLFGILFASHKSTKSDK